MQRERIGVDCDGVLADFVGSFVPLVKRLTGKDIPRVPHSWTWWDGIVSEEEIKEVWKWVRSNPEWWASLEPHSMQNLHLLGDWKDAGHDVYVMTTRAGDGALYYTQDWLRRMTGWHVPVMILPSAQAKGGAARALNLTKFVDDHRENTKEVYIQAPPSCAVYLYDAPHNQGEFPYYRIRSLKEMAVEVG